MNEQKEGLQNKKAEPDKPQDDAPESELKTTGTTDPDSDSVDQDNNSEGNDDGTEISPEERNKDNESEPTLEGLQYKIGVLSEALESAKDKSLRAQAEAENIRRRATIEQANSRKFAIEGFATELLSVKDSLDLAKKVELSEDNKDVIDKMHEGLSLTLKQLEQVFDKFSIQIISPEKGDKLNPEQHQAMTIVPSNEVEPNCILDVIQNGYQLHSRLLRPAMVVIAKKIEEKSSDSEQ